MKKEILDRYIDNFKEKVADASEKLGGDFNYYYEFGYADIIYMYNEMIKILSVMKSQWENTDESDIEFIARYKKGLLDLLLQTSPTGNSTLDAANQAKRLRLDAIRRLVTNYQIFDID